MTLYLLFLFPYVNTHLKKKKKKKAAEEIYRHRDTGTQYSKIAQMLQKCENSYNSIYRWLLGLINTSLNPDFSNKHFELLSLYPYP